jgi:hypothetical protein
LEGIILIVVEAGVTASWGASTVLGRSRLSHAMR